jgi:hypothetical protein
LNTGAAAAAAVTTTDTKAPSASLCKLLPVMACRLFF